MRHHLTCGRGGIWPNGITPDCTCPPEWLNRPPEPVGETKTPPLFMHAVCSYCGLKGDTGYMTGPGRRVLRCADTVACAARQAALLERAAASVRRAP